MVFRLVMVSVMVSGTARGHFGDFVHVGWTVEGLRAVVWFGFGALAVPEVRFNWVLKVY
jgi:hypothetical protein